MANRGLLLVYTHANIRVSVNEKMSHYAADISVKPNPNQNLNTNVDLGLFNPKPYYNTYYIKIEHFGIIRF